MRLYPGVFMVSLDLLFSSGKCTIQRIYRYVDFFGNQSRIFRQLSWYLTNNNAGRMTSIGIIIFFGDNSTAKRVRLKIQGKTLQIWRINIISPLRIAMLVVPPFQTHLCIHIGAKQGRKGSNNLSVGSYWIVTV